MEQDFSNLKKDNKKKISLKPWKPLVKCKIELV